MSTRASWLLASSLALSACARPAPAPAPSLELPRTAAPEVSAPAPAVSAAPVHVRPPSEPSVGTLRPDGRALAVWSFGARTAVQVWDLEEGRAAELVPEAKGMEAMRTVEWSPDGRSLARFFSSMGGGTGVIVWDLVRHVEWRGATGTVEHGSWSPDGSRILVESDFGNVHLFDAHAKRLVRTAQLHDPNAGAAMGFSWSPDSAMVAIIQVSGSIDLWDARTGATRKVIQTAPTGLDEAVKWSPDSALLAVPSVAGVTLYDGHTGATKSVLRADPGPEQDLFDLPLAWSPDGATLAVVFRKNIEVWDVKSATRRSSIPTAPGVYDDPPHALTWSPDGARLAFWRGRGTAGLWDTKQGSAPKTLRVCSDLAFSRDSTLLRCSPGDEKPPAAELYDGRTAERLLPRAASGRPTADGFAQEASARLFRFSDRLAIGFYRVEVGGRVLHLVSTDDGYYLGDREAAREILVRPGPSGKDEHLSDAELAARERSTLLADFVADRPIQRP